MDIELRCESAGPYVRLLYNDMRQCDYLDPGVGVNWFTFTVLCIAIRKS